MNTQIIGLQSRYKLFFLNRIIVLQLRYKLFFLNRNNIVHYRHKIPVCFICRNNMWIHFIQEWSESKFYSGLPQAWPDLMYSRQPERRAWQSAVHLRAVCQEVIPLVAIIAIWPRNLANDQIPAHAILHQQFLCLVRHKFLTRDFRGVRQIHGGLFGPKLYTNGLSWQTISRYYPFICGNFLSSPQNWVRGNAARTPFLWFGKVLSCFVLWEKVEVAIRKVIFTIIWGMRAHLLCY
jgi:hypothetical protein